MKKLLIKFSKTPCGYCGFYKHNDDIGIIATLGDFETFQKECEDTVKEDNIDDKITYMSIL